MLGMATGQEPIRIGRQPPFAVPPERRAPARRLRGRLVAPATVWAAGHPPAEAGPAAAARGRVINPIRVVAVNGRTRYRGVAEVHVCFATRRSSLSLAAGATTVPA
jgi:hypothetical protein